LRSRPLLPLTLSSPALSPLPADRANWRIFEPALQGFIDEFSQPVLYLPNAEVFMQRSA